MLLLASPVLSHPCFLPPWVHSFMLEWSNNLWQTVRAATVLYPSLRPCPPQWGCPASLIKG